MHNNLGEIARSRNLLSALAREGGQSWSRLLGQAQTPDRRGSGSNPPANFHFPYLVSRPMPYQCCDGEGREIPTAGGVLRTDQVVWLEQPLQSGIGGKRVTAFTSPTGMIRLDAAGLSAARHVDGTLAR